ncbi:MAG: hypothetical protein C7B43_04550 [Sulfobacillus benefaciens]|uniref:Uncharacterized protein n=1 Tax=Sulfobacillus benefaciens TaxID=453960 RepID=A0A2T2X8A7_9FIRM|nr:MAG: hypothetical protein C7B43_04550 [Sulfobacillus benefaciens]
MSHHPLGLLVSDGFSSNGAQAPAFFLVKMWATRWTALRLQNQRVSSLVDSHKFVNSNRVKGLGHLSGES